MQNVRAKKQKREHLVTVDLGEQHDKLLATVIEQLSKRKDLPHRYRWHPINKSDAIRLAVTELAEVLKTGKKPAGL